MGARVLWAVPTLLIVSLLVFLLIDIAPGDPARSIAGPDASQARVEEIRAGLDLSDPVLTRYARWVGRAVQGDLGTSLIGDKPVIRSIAEAIPPSASLVGLSIVISLVVTLVLGVGPVLSRNAAVGGAANAVAALLIAVPSMWIALLLIGAFALDRSWLPALGYVGPSDPAEWLRHLVLPALALSAITTGELTRQLRGALDDVMDSDFVVAARAKGLPHRKVVLKHGLKNGLVPMVTVLGVRIAQLIGSTVIIERIFLIDGIGRLTLTAVTTRDLPVILGVVVVASCAVQVLNLLVDASHGYFNPRLRHA